MTAPVASTGPVASTASVASTARVVAPGPTEPIDLRRDGERHAALGDHPAAVDCFRRAVYLDGEDISARLALALSLEALGDVASARRAFRAALVSLRREPEPTATVEGYPRGELAAMITARLHDEEGLE